MQGLIFFVSYSMVKINKQTKGDNMNRITSKPKFTYNELIKIYRMDIDSADYNKYKVAYSKWFRGLIKEKQLHDILKAI